MVDRESVFIRINSENGELVRYRTSVGNSILDKISMEELYRKLELPKDYELYKEENINGLKTIKYAKKYDDIYNIHESVTCVFRNDKIESITISNYLYENVEVNISKERALEIAKENDIEVDTIELSIEKINDLKEDFNRNEKYETIEECDIDNWKLFTMNVKIKKVWKIREDGVVVLIDTETGEIIDND